MFASSRYTLNIFRTNPCESLHVAPVYTVPVGLPYVYRLWVGDAVLSRLVVQQVKEVLHSQRDRTTGAEDDREQVIHKLLQRTLENTEGEGESA